LKLLLFGIVLLGIYIYIYIYIYVNVTKQLKAVYDEAV